MPTLAVTGCSYSDYTWVKKVYGEYAAESIGYDYLHLARGASGNHRGVLKVAKAIVEKKLVSGDIIIFQYTDPHRKIIPSTEPDSYMREKCHLPGNPELWNTQYGEGWTTDYKTHSHQWQGDGAVGERNVILHRALENYAVNPIFETEMMALHNTLLEALCKVNGVSMVPLINRYVIMDDPYRDKLTPGDIRGDIRNRIGSDILNKHIDEREAVLKGDENNPSEDDLAYAADNSDFYDHSHLSEIGHKKLGLYIAKHLKAHKLLKQQS